MEIFAYETLDVEKSYKEIKKNLTCQVKREN